MNQTGKKASRRVFLGLLRTAIGIGILVYLGVSGTIDWSALLGLMSAWPVTLAALLLLLVDVALMAWRLSLLFKPHGLLLSLSAALRLTFIGIFFNSFLPGSTGGDLVKLFYAAQGNHGQRTEVATIVLLDRVVGMFALLIFPLLIAPLFPQLLGSVPILRDLLRSAALLAVALLVGLLLCFSSRVRTSPLVMWIFQKLPGGTYGQKIFDTVHTYRYNLSTVIGAVAISILTHALTTGVTLLAVQATNPRGISWRMSVLIPLGHLANALPLTPGGLGVGEAAFDALFAMAGLTGGAEALLGWRLLTILISLLGLIFYLQGRRRFVRIAEVSPSSDSSA